MWSGLRSLRQKHSATAFILSIGLPMKNRLLLTPGFLVLGFGCGRNDGANLRCLNLNICRDSLSTPSADMLARIAGVFQSSRDFLEGKELVVTAGPFFDGGRRQTGERVLRSARRNLAD